MALFSRITQRDRIKPTHTVSYCQMIFSSLCFFLQYTVVFDEMWSARGGHSRMLLHSEVPCIIETFLCVYWGLWQPSNWLHAETLFSLPYRPRIWQATYYPCCSTVYPMKSARGNKSRDCSGYRGYRACTSPAPPVSHAVMSEGRWRVGVAGCCLGNTGARVIANQVTVSSYPACHSSDP